MSKFTVAPSILPLPVTFLPVMSGLPLLFRSRTMGERWVVFWPSLWSNQTSHIFPAWLVTVVCVSVTVPKTACRLTISMKTGAWFQVTWVPR